MSQIVPVPSSEIRVREFRHVLQWPLFLDPEKEASTGTVAELTEAARKSLEDSEFWDREENPLLYPPNADPDHDGGGYGEFVYFHDFVQSFLYPRNDSRAMQLFSRKDITGLQARIGGRTHEFGVERLTLHLTSPGVAVLTLELLWRGAETGETAPHILRLSDVLSITDHLRRTYPAFWYGEAPARVPEWVRLKSGDKWDEGACRPKPKAEIVATVEQGERRTPPIFAHWTRLLEPLELKADGGDWRDPSDERMPSHSYISLLTDGADADALDRISEADWVRIADAEEPSEGIAFPYNPDFSRAFLARAAYDRFMPTDRWRGMATRHLFGGQHYAAVGAGWFFDNIAVHHFRRHYTQLAFIARFQRASLLAISSRITAAVERRDWGGDGAGAVARFEKDILDLQEEFLSFTHRFRFTGVSSQVQPTEMYEFWRRSLELDALYDDVKGELESAVAAVRARQQRREAAAAGDTAKASERLAAYAAIGVALGLIVGAMGMNVFVGAEGSLGARLTEVEQFGWVAAGVGLLSLTLVRIIGLAGRKALQGILLAVALAGLVTAGAGGALATKAKLDAGAAASPDSG